MDISRRDLIAHWAFNTRPILGRFHLWLEDIDVRWVRGEPRRVFSFVGEGLEQCFVMTAAVTALGTRLFGRYGEGKGLDKAGLNRVKKDADAVSAYAMSEALWYLTRSLPENHAVMVSLGEGLMPKVGETPEMGSNPLLGFGRVYARPQVARFLDARVHRLINDSSYGWDSFWSEVNDAGLTVWGAAIDTLENTSRFAKGAETGPLTVLHLFDQPLEVSLPYEGYVGTLVLPRQVVEAAAEHAVLLDYLAPRARVLEAILATYPGMRPDHVHVWTLGGASRAARIGTLWNEWRALGAHVVEEGWTLPSGLPAFTESGTYAPTFLVGPFESGGERHVFICDGYAASAEAIQAASLDPILGLATSMCLFSPFFEVSYERESRVMHLDADATDFAERLGEVLGSKAAGSRCDAYRQAIHHARRADLPVDRRTLTVDDFFPNKRWRGLAIGGFMLPDPYTGSPGVEEVGEGIFRVTNVVASEHGVREVTATLRLMETREESRLVFSPLLDRFFAGQDYRTRAVKISDSGRIRNELQTWFSEALEYRDSSIVVDLERVDDAVVPPEKKRFIREVLTWYKQHHPIWFSWLELA